jgi:hypothetical protein
MKKVALPLLRGDREPSQLPALAVGGGAATLPLISLGQYWKNYYPEVSRRIQSVKELTPAQMARQARAGDVGLEGGIFAKSILKDQGLGALQRGSAYASGAPLHHGFVVGPRKRVFHGGINLEGAGMWGMKNMPYGAKANVRRQAGIPIIGKYNAIVDAWKSAKGDPALFLQRVPQYLRRMNNTLQWMGGLGTPEAMRPALDFLPDIGYELAGQADKDRLFALLRPKNLTRAEAAKAMEQLATEWHKPYDPISAAIAGVRNVLFPRTPEKLANKLTEACSIVRGAKGQHCGSLPAQIMQAIGRVRRRVGGASMELPGQMLANPNLELVGVVGRSAKERLVDLLRQSAKGRTLYGLGAAGALAGVGYGGARLAQLLSRRRRRRR